MTITQDSQWYDLPTQADEDALKASREKRRAAYWNKERLEEFWGRNPTQEFNDHIETQDDIQSEFQEAMGGGYEPCKEAPKKIRRFPSGAVRSDDTGRLRPDFISPLAIQEIAKHFTNAKNDFGATNYYLGIKPEDIIPSVARHYVDLMEAYAFGDKEKLREEFRAMACNCVMALHQIVLEERGLYKEIYDNTELVDAKEYLRQMEKDKQRELLTQMMRGDEELGLYDSGLDNE